MRWTHDQDEFLLAHAHKGAEWCRREMLREFGILRSADAIWRHSYRAGISMRRRETCPECGREVQQLSSTSGLCRECHMHILARRSRELRDAVERASSERDDEREYERNRKWIQRHYADIVKLSQKMSQRRSGRESEGE